MGTEALKLALEFIERTSTYLPTTFDSEGLNIHATIKAALAAPVQEPVAWLCGRLNGDSFALTVGQIDELGYGNISMKPFEKLAPLYTTPPAARPTTEDSSAVQAAPVQEPVAWVTGLHAGRCVIKTVRPAAVLPVGIALYTHPAPAAPVQEFECPRCGHCCGQRQWVGLTEEEMHEYAGEYPWTPTGLKCARAIEAKLKEKNT